ncbi:hypothetical protein F522_09275 [Enterococcus hirae 81-15-F4]|nr:hypothetical protein F522_09275 [Enterococcus hirae 81-15-F4]
MKDCGVGWIGEIPESWELRKLKYILDERKEKNNPVITDNILSLSIEKGVFPYSEKTGGGNKAKDDLTAYKVARPNDIVINSMNILAGAVGISNYTGAVSPVYYTLYSSSSSVNIKYYYYLFLTETFQKSLLGLGNGIMMKESANGKLNTIRMRISMDKLASLYLPILSYQEQERIVKRIDSFVKRIDAIISETQQSINELKKYKQALITETVTKGLDKNVEMKDSGIEWIGKISSTFQLPKLGSVTLKIGSGKTPSGGESVYVPEGILFLRSQNIYDEGLEISSPRFISEEIDEQMSGTRVMQGDVLLNITGGSIGRSTVYTLNQPANVNQHVCIIRTSEETLLPEWLNLCLMSNIGKQSVLFFQTGGNREGLNFADISKIRIPLPTLSTQKEIIRYLSGKLQHIQVLINQKEEAVKVYSEYKNSLIYEYVTGKKEA